MTTSFINDHSRICSFDTSSVHTSITLTLITDILKNKVDQNLNTSLVDQELIHIINVVMKQDFFLFDQDYFTSPEELAVG